MGRSGVAANLLDHIVDSRMGGAGAGGAGRTRHLRRIECHHTGVGVYEEARLSSTR